MQWKNMVNIVTVTGDGGKESVYFSFPKWIEEKARTKEEKKMKVAPKFGPVIISKRTINLVLTQIKDLTSGYRSENYDKLLRYSEKNLASGISVFIKEQQMLEDSREDPQPVEMKDEEGKVIATTIENPKQTEIFRSLLGFLDETIQEMEQKESTANPLREALNVLVKSAKYADLDYKNPGKIMDSWKAAELARIEGIFQKGKEVTEEAFRAYVKEKFDSCGVDKETGMLRLKAESEKKDEKPEEKKEEVTTQS